MGVAEVIPGISGGTLALILGIYERLINAISAFNLELISLLKNQRIFEAWDQVDGTFIKLPSDSSDSNTLHSLFPSLAELSNELITPPFIIVGSNLALEKIDAIKDVVVVLPWDPETTMFF